MESLTLLYFIGLVLALFAILATAFGLVTFSRLRQVPQPKRSLLLGFGSGATAGLLCVPLIFSGGRNTWLGLFVIGILTVTAALIGLLGSAETISAKRHDETIRKSDDGGFGYM
jgi:drug/metabolite transporter (DMT)-like permease